MSPTPSIIDAIEARQYLETHDAAVMLNISLHIYQAKAGVNDKEQIYIEGLGDTHIHNISHIQINDIFTAVNWSEP